MAPNEDSKNPKEDGKEEDAVSLQSNPPSDEASEYQKERVPSAEDASSTPVEPPEKEGAEGIRADTLQTDDFIGKYRVLKMIGRGGMASVYRGIDDASQRVVAVKVLKEKFSSSAKARARFDREFLALETLNHPNIVQVLDKGEQDGVNYFVMEHINGASLSRLLRHRELALNTKAQILLHIAAALDYAHRRGIVHRDVKPDNVLIDRTGRAKLADFGIAQITRSHLPHTSITMVSSYMGTADYMAPEQRVNAKGVDHRADIYAFGVMMYEVFTGKLPLGNFPLPSQLNPELSKRMDGMILRALQQDPADRYQTITALAEDLKREISASGLSRLKARLALVLQNEGWRRFFTMRTMGTAAMFAVILYGVVWFLSALGGPSSQEGISTDEEGKPGLDSPPVSSFPGRAGSAQAEMPPKDMILVPAGMFVMGSDSEFDNERPMRRVHLDAFYIDKYEVTNAEYKKFIDATGHRIPSGNSFEAGPFNWHNGTYPPGKGDHPVVLVSWNDARAYAKWAGKRLPTEAEWEKAARGEDGRVWPWGNQWDAARCNIEESFLYSTQPVHSFANGRSPYGCHNAAGNAMEWVADRYSENYYRQAPDRNPPGPEFGSYRVIRGGAWDSNISLYARTAYRYFLAPGEKKASVGFRCAKDVKKK
jgi:serine/threonine-protein kinase